ncbi:MAG: SGNH/GDSL hydrolase family protein [Candidatus Hodarchaeota archaeon]
MGRNIKRNVKILGYIIAVIITFELLLRIFIPELNYFYKASLYFRYAMEDNGLYWINKPGYQDDNVRINSMGYRSFETAEKWSKRLLILGDSVGFGWGVCQDSIFSSRLNLDYEIINCSIPGSNTIEQARLLQYEGLSLQPDIVLMIITNNDVANRSKRPTRLQKNLYRSYLLTALFYIKKRSIKPYYDRLQYNHAQHALEKIYDLCRTKLICCLYTTPELIKKDKVMRFYAQFLIDNKIPFFIFSSEVLNHPINRIDRHPNERGHELIAETIEYVFKN